MKVGRTISFGVDTAGGDSTHNRVIQKLRLNGKDQVVGAPLVIARMSYGPPVMADTLREFRGKRTALVPQSPMTALNQRSACEPTSRKRGEPMNAAAANISNCVLRSYSAQCSFARTASFLSGDFRRSA